MHVTVQHVTVTYCRVSNSCFASLAKPGSNDKQACYRYQYLLRHVTITPACYLPQSLSWLRLRHHVPFFVSMVTLTPPSYYLPCCHGCINCFMLPLPSICYLPRRQCYIYTIMFPSSLPWLHWHPHQVTLLVGMGTFPLSCNHYPHLVTFLVDRFPLHYLVTITAIM